jgi:4-amino-4-deoxy-L-arabinose transferase-like glycosyltransferase
MRSWSVKETWTAAALFLGTVLSRLPFRSQILYHWDSVNFAFAMQRFDVAAEQPQPPGYIAYVWLCRLVDLLFHDPQTTMVWISVLASGLAVVAMYLLGRAMFGQRTGLMAALFLASSPLFWFYGEIAVPHTLDAFLVTVSAWSLYRTMRGRTGFLYPTVVFLALVGGVRQQSLTFLLPLSLFALRRVGWRRLLTAALLGAVLCSFWAVPLVGSCGGVARYLEVFSRYSGRFTATTSVLSGAGWQGLQHNVSKLSRYLLYAWSVALIPPIVYALIRSIRGHWRMKWERVVFLGLWCVPTILLYVFIHMGQQGMIFTFLPALLIISAATLVRLLEARPIRFLAWLSVLLVTVNAAFFLLLPEYPLGRERFKVLSWDTLRNNDAYYQERFDAIREHFPAESTVIIAARWRHVEWYLPEYVYLPVAIAGKREKDASSPIHTGREERAWIAEELGLSLSPGDTMTVVLFDRELGAFNMNPNLIQSLALRDGAELEFMILQEYEMLLYTSDEFKVQGR